MSIPLDRLYHYIESIAQEVYNDDIVIYRFYPHGSKKLTDLLTLRTYDHLTYITRPHIYCNDQEPLNYEYYQNIEITDHPEASGKRILKNLGISTPNTNFHLTLTVFDKVILIHSEERSINLAKYQANVFIPVYYWSHAIIARDWFRYAKYVNQTKQVSKLFLVYNRAWAGSREYRLKFADLLIDNNLSTLCNMTFSFTDPELELAYTKHDFKNTNWRPKNKLEDYFNKNLAESSASADFDLADYESADFEIVLETLFDDDRLHLTEKVLRPIAVGQPFMLVSTHGSLAYLRRYGFKTFESVIDEGYDTIEDPVLRLQAVVDVMKTISEWSEEERVDKMSQLTEIAEYNKNYFFNNDFSNLIINELKTNLKLAFIEQENTNTGKIIDWRKKLNKHPIAHDKLVGNGSSILRKNIAEYVRRARQYYNRR